MSKTKPARERATQPVSSLVTPSMHQHFARWAGDRNLSVSSAVRALISDALSRDPRTAGNVAYSPLPSQSANGAHGVTCGCCGLLHDRALHPGEHCDWCVWEGREHTRGTAGYRPLPARTEHSPDSGQEE